MVLREKILLVSFISFSNKLVAQRARKQINALGALMDVQRMVGRSVGRPFARLSRICREIPVDKLPQSFETNAPFYQRARSASLVRGSQWQKLRSAGTVFTIC